MALQYDVILLTYHWNVLPSVYYSLCWEMRLGILLAVIVIKVL